MSFYQDPPRLGNQYDDDPLLQEWLARHPALADTVPELRDLGELARTLHEFQAQDRVNEPRLVQWDPWGRRVDRIEVSPLWREAQKIAAQRGLVATAYERRHGALSRPHQFILCYLAEASMDVYSCPLAMTDGAARTLLDLGNKDLIDRAVPRLTSRDPSVMWTSGQWMTERTGGSDVGLSETVARQVGGEWRLYGTKWFTSATTSQMTLTLARPDGNPAGGKGLALFYLELQDGDGRWNGISVNRLKDKLGTRKVPTAELTLDGARAIPVAGLEGGIKNITPMLSVTRTWNAVGAIGGMRRAIALVKDYARRRSQFGAPLADKPLHRDTIAAMQAELDGAFLISMRAAHQLGRREAGEIDAEDKLFRILTPIVKLTTAKQAVAVASEALECFGGAGYVEDTGLPRILRDAQVLPIWEGTTNVLSLDTLRAMTREGTLDALVGEIHRALAVGTEAGLAAPVAAAKKAVAHACTWLERSRNAVEAGARRFAMTMGRALEVALLVEHAQAAGPRAAASARQLARAGIDLIVDDDTLADAELLAR
jgi:alkylation response protein AidB-like acyl-CoA dehydrogenase